MDKPIDYNKELFVEGHIRTFTGIYFDAFNPDPEKIDIRDIAHALSMQCRYAGHLPKFYSVAQHSLYCARLAPPHLKLAMLLHDAAEAYLLDIPSPFKARMPDYKAAENHLLSVIFQKYSIQATRFTHAASMKAIDIMTLKDEWDFLVMGRPCNKPMFPARAADQATDPALVEKLFLLKFETYYNYKYITP